MKRIATALAALLLAAGISWGQDPDLTGFLEQLENVNGRMATAMNNDDKEEMENLYTEIVVMYEQQPGSVKKTAAPIMGGVWYNLACLRSLRGDTDGIAPAAVCGRHATPYGTEYLVRRSAVPAGMTLGQVNIEDLFVFMAKEA